jgi:hypothetical protein
MLLKIIKDGRIYDEFVWTGNNIKIVPGKIILGKKFVGYIDEFYIVNSRLTEREILSIINWNIAKIR